MIVIFVYVVHNYSKKYHRTEERFTGNTEHIQISNGYFKRHCLNNSVATLWDGPSSNSSNIFNETPYTVNDQIVQQLPNAKNLMLVGDISVGEYNLKIINLTHNEEGYYKCNAQRGNQLFEFQYVLKIKAADYAFDFRQGQRTYRPSIRFNINEHNITVYEGRPFSITCFSDSNPFTTEIFWKRNGELIDKDTQRPKSVPLNIATIKRQHEGKYTCRAKNQNGYGQKSIYITVVCKFINVFCFFVKNTPKT
ncbi:CNTN2 [Mytilus coruscus]|uniref:CNTN2 n=1 Tax=Mytilus coruscus TaxID=42192 RepID=A0A6J8CDY6_MYTCO|nr:CNTN2 [Mytilus coruscus]